MTAHYLYLTNDRLIAWVKRGETTVAHEKFAATDIAFSPFIKHLHTYRNVPIHLFVDLIEEDYRLDTVPHLRGSDQQAVLERRLGQLYRASTFRHALIQGREAEGRRDDRVFFHAITNPDLLKSVVAAIETSQAPLEGIYSSPVLSHLLLQSLNLVFPHTLLVSIVPDFGLRQTYFQESMVKFSRITPISYDEGQSVGTLIAAETSRTWQYLDNLRFFSSEDSLEVCILVHARDRAMISDAIRSFPLLRYRILDIGEVAARIKLKPVPSSSHAEEVLVHLYSKSRLDNHFASSELKRFAIFRRARIALFGVTAAILAASVAVTAFNFFQATQITRRIDIRGVEERALQAEYQAVANTIRQQKVGTDTVRDASIFFNSQLRPVSASPGPLSRDLAAVLGEFPLVKISQLTWSVSNDPGFTPVYQQQLSSGSANITSTIGLAAMALVAGPVAAAKAIAGAGAPAGPAVSRSDPDPPLAGNKYHVIVVDAAVLPAIGDLRAALAEVERLRARLATIRDATATVLVAPVDVASDAALKIGNQDTVGPVATDARFVVKLTQKVADT